MTNCITGITISETVLCHNYIVVQARYSMNQNREFIYKRIGAKVAYFRISNGLTQKEMAAKIHVSRSTVSKIERGNYNRSISLDLLLDIADGLGIDLSMLFVLDRKEEEYWESVNGNELK